jgi:hypothetical protein
MRPHRSGTPKTNLTSLVAAAAIVGLVAWIAGHATTSESIYANDRPVARPAAVAASHPPARPPAPKPTAARDG